MKHKGIRILFAICLMLAFACSRKNSKQENQGSTPGSEAAETSAPARSSEHEEQGSTPGEEAANASAPAPERVPLRKGKVRGCLRDEQDSLGNFLQNYRIVNETYPEPNGLYLGSLDLKRMVNHEVEVDGTWMGFRNEDGSENTDGMEFSVSSVREVSKHCDLEDSKNVAQFPEGGSEAPMATGDHLFDLRFEAGVRLLIRVNSINRKSDGNFAFRGVLLQPVARVGVPAPLSPGTELAGAGTVRGRHVTILVTEFTIGGANYALQRPSRADTQPGTGSGIELDGGKVLEMWLASPSAYQKTARLGISSQPPN
ncbi:MAG: hypothetical protein WCA20_11825 [Candidatus Sulfotelmatobacter sp.]